MLIVEKRYWYSTIRVDQINKLTVSGPVTFVGGGIDLNVLRSSGPGLLRDKRLRTWFADDKPTLPNGFAAKSNPFFDFVTKNTKYN